MPITTDFAAQKVVDEKIHAEFTRHRNRIKVLKIRRNSYCAVNQLPSDILTEIFMTFKLLVGECSLSSRTFEWTTLFHVCDAWYHQIMNTPRFWSVVDLNLPFASRMMALSKAAPLQVTVRVPPDVGESLWSLVAKALSPRHRLQELTIRLPDSKAFSRAFNSVPPNSTAPYLEHLTIDVANVEGKFSGYFWTDLPSLRSLSLANTPLPWETHSMPNLVILDIGTQQYDHRPTISWLLTALKYMPHIQTISVSRLRGSSDPRAPPIPLSCLKNLRVGSMMPPLSAS